MPWPPDEVRGANASAQFLPHPLTMMNDAAVRSLRVIIVLRFFFDCTRRRRV
jgi:hypothetical protein